MTKAPSLGEGSQDCPREGVGTEGDRRVERRRVGQSRDSPLDFVRRLSAVVVLGRMPTPSLAMARDGIIVFANRAFAELVGYRQDRLTGAVFPKIFRTVPAAVCALSGVYALPNLVVELQHREGWTVRARMSKSALMR